MIVKLYSIRDLKMGKYCQPFVAPNDDVAKRMLASQVMDNRVGNSLSEFAEDYQLYRMGTYDEDTGALATDNAFIANASEFKRGGNSNGVSNRVQQDQSADE